MSETYTAEQLIEASEIYATLGLNQLEWLHDKLEEMKEE